MDRKLSKDDFTKFKGKFDQCLASWKAKILSTTSKIVLTKCNLTSIPEYSINWFKFPKFVCNDINKTSGENFWNSIKVVHNSIKLLPRIISVDLNLNRGLELRKLKI